MTAQEEYERNLDRFQRYLEKRGYGGTTLDMYPRAVRMLWAFFERAGRFPSPVEITVGDLREFAVYLLSKHTGSSPTGYIVGLRRFFGFLEAEGVITRSPARNVLPPKAHPRPANPLQRRELSALLRACSGSGFADLRDMALFRIFMATGARRSEVVGLRVDPDDNGRDTRNCHSAGNKRVGKGLSPAPLEDHLRTPLAARKRTAG